MILYDTKELEQLRIQEEVESAYDAGLLSESELNQVKLAYPSGFYGPNLIIRSGMFILTWICCLFGGLILSLILEPAHIIDHPGWPIFLGIGGYVGLELFVRLNKHFHSGVDDALLWLSAIVLAGGLIWAFSNQLNANLWSAVCILILSGWSALRFVNTLMSSIACLAALAVVFFAWNKAGALGEATMPFMIMLCSYLIYNLTSRSKADPRALYYQKCLVFVQVTSLLTLYAAGNYLVVQKLSNQLHHLPLETNNPIPFGWIFWCWTILLPIAYIALGIRKKNLLLLRLGMLLIAAAAYTFRFYYHLLAIEYVLAIAGVLTLVLVIALIRYLKTPKHGFTYAQRSRKHWVNNLNIESLVVAGVASHTQSVPIESKDRFGGGHFGGGGASADF
jgi:hypothetical protein